MPKRPGVNDVRHFMIDLETFSLRVDCAIATIACCEFDHTGVTRHYEDAAALDGRIDDATLSWWHNQQKRGTPLPYRKGAMPLRGVLLELADFIGNGPRWMWAKPSTFDLAILAEAYARHGLVTPWEYHEVRCLMTFASLYPDVPSVRPDTKHIAIDDAIAQAKTCIRLMREHGTRLS